MPARKDIRSILIIGSGPIVIGQACEFDYSGTQACKILRKLGYKVILVNSNPATIMTDPELADVTYIEPLTPEFVRKIIELEKPDAILPTMGGQTALNIAVSLAEAGILEKHNVEMIGANLRAIQKAEDRELFKETVTSIGLDVPKGGFVKTISQAMTIIKEVGFPAIIRPSFTLGGMGGGVAYNIEEYEEIARHGLSVSPISEILVEESVIGWKEFELEVMRDKNDNVVIVCSIENVDPMGVHTGDSITVAPAQTLTDREYQTMRDWAKKIIRAVGVETGGSNIQFAVNPSDGRMVVIEMNPRVSRSSALASKATGFPIAKIAAMLAVGLTLDEIPNDITKKTPASFEPSIDYVVVKIPRWDFEKFKGADDTLGVQMKSVGEAMAFGRTFKEALQKALSSLEQGRNGLGADGKDKYSFRSVRKSEVENYRKMIANHLKQRKPDNIFFIRLALEAGFSVDEIYELTRIDKWFLKNIEEIVSFENQLINKKAMNKEILLKAKQLGFSDIQIAEILGVEEKTVRNLRKSLGVIPVFKTVDTCAAEFEAETPYHFSTYEEENEFTRSKKEKVVILGSGPNRIGQGIEFDYCCVHGVLAAQEEGYEAIMINCNPETVSTDYDTADKLYFEPLTFENVMNVIEAEDPSGVIVSFGGQTPLKLAKALEEAGVRLLGTGSEGIDIAEDRKRFGELLQKLGIPHPMFGTAYSVNEAVDVASFIGYPVLVRPSYVLGGRAMEICYNEASLRNYMRTAAEISPDKPVLIDRFLEDAFEFDVDAVADGEDVVIGAIMEHIEEAGIHSGDSAAVIPPYMITEKCLKEIKEYTKALAKGLNVIGLMNIQFAMKDDIVYVLEVNPRASRTVPFVSKSIGIPLAKVAAKVMLGKKLKDLNFVGVNENHKHVSIKEAVFPFNRFTRVKVFLGPEMRSTGEVMGIDSNFGAAYAKSQAAAGNPLPTEGNVLFSVNDNDKNEKTLQVAREFINLGFKIIATEGTSKFFSRNGIENEHIFKVSEGRPNIVDYIKNGKIQFIINTPLGEESRFDEYAIGWAAIEHKVSFATTLSAASAAVRAIKTLQRGDLSVKSIQQYHKSLSDRQPVQLTGNSSTS
ncbi:MAG: carbamoyl-phosphate synthase large subunit [Candidatus Kryptoniota bacterium]